MPKLNFAELTTFPEISYVQLTILPRITVWYNLFVF